MRNLLSTYLTRLIRHRIFWLELGVALMFSLAICFSNYIPESEALQYDFRICLDNVFFTFFLTVGLFCAASISLILGTEYSEGAIRNKLTVGHKRVPIYLAVLAVSVAASWTMLLVHLLVTGSVGRLLYGGFAVLDSSQVAFALVCVFLATAVYSAICVAVSMNCQSKAVSAVGCFLLALGMAYAASYLGRVLAEPELIQTWVSGSDPNFDYDALSPNPFYVGGVRRRIYEFLYILLPDGQINSIYSLNVVPNVRWVCSSVGMFVGVSALGCGIFRKKDIR